MDYQLILEEIYEEIKPYLALGKVADYIPELKKVSPDNFAMVLQTADGEISKVGDFNTKFSIQSISKLFTLTLALQFEDKRLWQRVGREPSGNPFNSLVQLEYEKGIPRNPFINAGALVITDIILSRVGDAKKAIIDYLRLLSGNSSIKHDPKVYASEKKTGYLNKSIANYLKSFNNLDNQPSGVLDVYFYQCSISMNCIDLSNACSYLVHSGYSPLTKEAVSTTRQTKYLNSLLLTCGTYDAVGDFAYRVGLPGKSGVGGGIIAVLPGQFNIAVWSPGLNDNGNSLAGVKALEMFTTITGKSIF